MRRTIALLVAVGCTPDAPVPVADGGVTPDASAAMDLVTTSAWVVAAVDPWAAHLDPARPCDPLGLRDEGSFFEIDTRVCGAVTVEQPSNAAVRASDRLTALVWNLGLTSDPPASGHVALAIDGNVVLDEVVPIPSEARVFELDLPATFDAPAGAPVRFHVHNHGSNNWRIAYVRVTRP